MEKAETLRKIAEALREWGDSSDPKIKSGLAWVAEGTEKYVPAVIAKKPRTDKKNKEYKGTQNQTRDRQKIDYGDEE